MNSAQSFRTMAGILRLVKASHPLKSYVKLPANTRSLFQYRQKYSFSSNIINGVANEGSKNLDTSPKTEGFNPELILREIVYETKRLNTLAISSEEIRKMNDPRLQELTSSVLENLRNFNKPKDLGRAALFILRCCPADSQTVSTLTSYLSTYDDLLLIERPVLEQVIPYVMKTKPNGYQAFLEKFSTLLKEKGRSLDINDFILLLDIWNNSLKEKQAVGAGTKSKQFQEFVNQQKDLFLTYVNSINSVNLVHVFEFYFDTPQDSDTKKLMSAIEKKFIKNYPGFKPPQIVKLINMLAELGSLNEDLWIRLEEEVIIKIHEFNPQQLIVILNSFAGMEIGTEGLFSEISRKISTSIELVDPQDIPFIVLNLAKSGKHIQKTFEDLYPIMMDNIQNYSPSQLIDIFWSYTISSKINDKLYSVLEKNLIEKIEDLEVEHYTLLIDSLTYYKKTSPDLVFKAFSKIREYFLKTKDLSLLDSDLAISTYYYGMEVSTLDQDVDNYLKTYFLWRLNNLTVADIPFIITFGPLLIQSFDKGKADEELVIAYGNIVKPFYEKERALHFNEKDRADMSLILSDFKRVLNKYQVQ